MKSKSDLLTSVTTFDKIRSVIDKLPNLKSSYLETLYYEYEISQDAHLLYLALELGSNS